MRGSTLDTATVVGEAVRLADDHGVAAVTMRKLADRLGVQAMALYRHVTNRDALLDAMIAAPLNQLAATMTRRTTSPTTHSTYLTDIAHDVLDLALTHTWLIELMVLRPVPAVWLSRPLSSLACTNSFLDALHRRGSTPAASVGTYRTFNAFLLTHLLPPKTAAVRRPPIKGHRRGPPVPPAPHLLLQRYPILVDHLELLTTDDLLAHFPEALHLFVLTVTHNQPDTVAARPPPPLHHPTTHTQGA